jgi:hypothetical protein
LGHKPPRSGEHEITSDTSDGYYYHGYYGKYYKYYRAGQE